MNIAVILAGGSGTRVGGSTPKQFVEVLGKPVIAYTIERFQNHPEIDAIEVVCVKSHIAMLQSIVDQYSLFKVCWIAEGGNTFQDSVISGIENLRMHASDDDIVLVHYAASPFVGAEIISDCIRVAREKGNSTSATPCYLLLGSNDDGAQSTQWVDRDKIMQLNSPQCFRYGYVKWLYETAAANGVLDEVEPHTTSLMFRMGQAVYFAKGDQTNIKITTKEDLALFEGYVLLERSRLTDVGGQPP